MSPEEKTISEEIEDYGLLPYILLYKAQMHPIDLRRTMSSMRNGDLVRVAPGELRTSALFRREALMQIAIEIVLDDEDVRVMLDEDSRYRQMAHDAMYYIFRTWNVDEDIQVSSPQGSQRFRDYLQRRAGSSKPIARHDVAFFSTKVERLGELLSDTVKLRTEFERWTEGRQRRGEEALAPVVLDLVSQQQEQELPLRTSEWGKVRWRFDRAGRRSEMQPVDLSLPEWTESANLIEAVDAALMDITQ